MKEKEPPRQIGSIAMSNGPYLDPISTHTGVIDQPSS